MTRERAKELAPIIAAFGSGKEIQFQYSEYEWCPAGDPSWDDNVEYRIKPEPKKRPMTREEVLGFLANTPGIVTRFLGSESRGHWALPDWSMAYGHVQRYQWATIDAKGNIGEPHAFEVEE